MGNGPHPEMRSILLAAALLWGAPPVGTLGAGSGIRGCISPVSPAALLAEGASVQSVLVRACGGAASRPGARHPGVDGQTARQVSAILEDHDGRILSRQGCPAFPLGARDPYRDAARAPPRHPFLICS